MMNLWLCRSAQDQVHLCARSFRLLLPARCQNRREHMGRKRHTSRRFHHRIRVCHSDKQHGCPHHLPAALPGCGELCIRLHIHPPCPAGLGSPTSRQAMPLAKGCQRAHMCCKAQSSLAGHPPCSSFARRIESRFQIAGLCAQRTPSKGHACSAIASIPGCKPTCVGL